MTVKQIISDDIMLYTSQTLTYKRITGVYCSDLLSMVLGKANEGNLLITIQNHMNTIAISSLIDLSAIIFVEGMLPSTEMIYQAEEHGIALLSSPKSAVYVIETLLNIKGSDI